jgi:hypothetical protein
MVGPTDIRLKASGLQIARARVARFPIRLRVQGTGARPALAQARRVIDELRQAAADAEFDAARLDIPDPDTDTGRSASELTIEQKSPREVRLQLAFAVALGLEKAGGFWDRAAALAEALDLLQGFARRPHDKGVEIDVQQGCTIDEGPTRSMVREEGTV